MGTAFTTPAELSHFQLCAIRGRLKLESKGLKFRGGATRPAVAASLGLKPRDTYDKFLSVIETKIEESRAQLQGEPA